jgi:NAD(P)-dependent dehydrogenase (short-subunit alcohol dehydrogenase family)
VLRPPTELCKPSGVVLGAGSRVLLAGDANGIGKALAARLERRGVEVVALDPRLAAEAFSAQLQACIATGSIGGVFWLPALDAAPIIEEMEPAEWRELNRVRIKNLYETMRALEGQAVQEPIFLISATRLGGMHGYGEHPASAPLGGAVTGFTKAYKREHSHALVKAVDFEPGRRTVEPAEALIAEALADPGIVEVGYADGLRYGIAFEERPAADGQAGMTLNRETVVVVSGAAGGITSAIIADLAAASGGIFYLLDLAPAPRENAPEIALLRSDREALKRSLIEAAQAAGERPTPVQIEKRIAALEREEAAVRAIEAVRAAGGTAHYYSLDLRDSVAVARAIDDVRAAHGRIDVLLHAGGLEISRALADKEPGEFNLVFDVKADGFYHLLRAAKGMPIGATVAFSSIAGRFGNSGQTDYSAANDLLCKMTSNMRAWRPDTRAIVIDWTAWGGIGMATRGSIPKIMEAAGIDMLPPEAGISTIRRELTAGGTRGEIIVGQRLGILVEELDPHGGLDPQKVAGLPLIGADAAAPLYGGLQVATTLDPREQPFLNDHRIDGVPVLPGVMGIEAFAELACLFAPGYVVAALEQVRFLAPFKFHRDQARTLQLSATITPVHGGMLVAHAALHSVTKLPEKPGVAPQPPRVELHFTADVCLRREPPAAPTIGFTPPSTEGLPIDRERIYRAYFHGPAYQVLERAGVGATNATALMAAGLPPDHEGAPFFTSPRLIELCFQAAGIWEMQQRQQMALPAQIERVELYRTAEEAAGRRLYALVDVCDNGAAFDVRVVDEAGQLYTAVKGYQTIALPVQVMV